MLLQSDWVSFRVDNMDFMQRFRHGQTVRGNLTLLCVTSLDSFLSLFSWYFFFLSSYFLIIFLSLSLQSAPSCRFFLHHLLYRLHFLLLSPLLLLIVFFFFFSYSLSSFLTLFPHALFSSSYHLLFCLPSPIFLSSFSSLLFPFPSSIFLLSFPSPSLLPFYPSPFSPIPTSPSPLTFPSPHFTFSFPSPIPFPSPFLLPSPSPPPSPPSPPSGTTRSVCSQDNLRTQIHFKKERNKKINKKIASSCLLLLFLCGPRRRQRLVHPQLLRLKFKYQTGVHRALWLGVGQPLLPPSASRICMIDGLGCL